MFFSTFDPYIENDEIIYCKKSINNNTDDDNCFICFQIEKNNDTRTVKMINITKYKKKL